MAHSKQFMNQVCSVNDLTDPTRVLGMVIVKVCARKQRGNSSRKIPVPSRSLQWSREKNNSVKCSMCYNGESQKDVRGEMKHLLQSW